MDRFQMPAAPDELAGKPLEEFRVGRGIGLGAEVARRRDQPGAEVLLPDPVDDHAGGEASRSSLGIGDPAGQARAASFAGRLQLPLSPPPCPLRGSGENLEKPRRCDPLVLADIAAAEEPGFGVGVGIAAAIGVMGDRRQMVAGDEGRELLRGWARPLDRADE